MIKERTKYINLLPPAYVQKKELISYTIKIAVSQAAIFLFFVLFVLVLEMTNSFVDRSSERVNLLLKDKAYIQSDLIAGTLREKQAEYERLSSIVDTIDLTEGLRGDTVYSLANHLPEQMDIQSISVVNGSDITVKTSAADINAVSVYLDSLESSFDNCKLVSMSVNEIGIDAEISIYEP